MKTKFIQLNQWCPSPEDLTCLGEALPDYVDGTKYKEFWVDSANRLWLFRVNPSRYPDYRPLAVETYYRFARMVIDTPVEAYAAVLESPDGKPETGTLELVLFKRDVPYIEWKTCKDEEETGRLFKQWALPSLKHAVRQDLVSIDTFSPAQITQVLDGMVVDWLLSNHDASPENFLFDPGTGDLFGIDKEQCFKLFPQGRLDLDYLPNHPKYKPLAWLVVEMLASRNRLDILLLDGILSRVVAMSDDVMAALLAPLARELVPFHQDDFPGLDGEDTFIRAVLERKHLLLSDFAGFFNRVNGVRS